MKEDIHVASGSFLVLGVKERNYLKRVAEGGDLGGRMASWNLHPTLSGGAHHLHKQGGVVAEGLAGPGFGSDAWRCRLCAAWEAPVVAPPPRPGPLIGPAPLGRCSRLPAGTRAERARAAGSSPGI